MGLESLPAEIELSVREIENLGYVFKGRTTGRRLDRKTKENCSGCIMFDEPCL